MKNEAYLSLGTNMGDREENLRRALVHISQLPQTHICRISGIYETEPVGYTDQSSFLNMVVVISTQLEPLELLAHMQEIENKLKRVRSVRWGPRTLDIDILLFDKIKIDTDMLTIPHPRMLERAFVLIPLKEVYLKPELSGRDINDLIELCSDRQGVREYKKWKVESRK